MRRLAWPALISLGSIVPFAVLEMVNRRHLPEPFPFVLFATLWFLAMTFLVVVTSLVRRLRAGDTGVTCLVLRVSTLAVIAWLWGSILLDQMPCFLGVPGCD